MTTPAKLHGKALCLFTPRNWFRQAVARIALHKHFDNVILVWIILSSVCLAIENPTLDPESGVMVFLDYADYVFTAVFVCEMSFKVIALGMMGHPKAYMSSGWNVLDGTIVTISVLSLASAGNNNLMVLKSLRTLRVLRPLRMIARNEGLKLVVNALLRAIPSIINVMVVSLLVFLIFAVFAVNLFKGTFYNCEGVTTTQFELVTNPLPFSSLNNASRALGIDSIGYSPTDLTSRAVCDWLNGTWTRTIPQSFDNVGLAFVALFQSTTGAGRGVVSHHGCPLTVCMCVWGGGGARTARSGGLE